MFSLDKLMHSCTYAPIYLPEKPVDVTQLRAFFPISFSPEVAVNYINKKLWLQWLTLFGFSK